MFINPATLTTEATGNPPSLVPSSVKLRPNPLENLPRKKVPTPTLSSPLSFSGHRHSIGNFPLLAAKPSLTIRLPADTFTSTSSYRSNSPISPFHCSPTTSSPLASPFPYLRNHPLSAHRSSPRMLNSDADENIGQLSENFLELNYSASPIAIGIETLSDEFSASDYLVEGSNAPNAYHIQPMCSGSSNGDTVELVQQFSCFETIDDHDDYQVATSFGSDAMCTGTTTTSDGSAATMFGEIDFAFYGAMEKLLETTPIANTKPPSPLVSDLYMSLLKEHVVTVSTPSFEGSATVVCDQPAASLSPNSPSSPLIYHAIHFNHTAISNPALISNTLSPFSPPLTDTPLTDQKIFMPLHSSLALSKDASPKPKSKSNLKRQRGSGFFERDAKSSKVFICEEQACGKVFKRLEHLKRHVRSLHTLERPFQCPVVSCGKHFSRSDNLNYHLRTHQTKWIQQQNEANMFPFNPYLQANVANPNGMVI